MKEKRTLKNIDTFFGINKEILEQKYALKRRKKTL